MAVAPVGVDENHVDIRCESSRHTAGMLRTAYCVLRAA